MAVRVGQTFRLTTRSAEIRERGYRIHPQLPIISLRLSDTLIIQDDRRQEGTRRAAVATQERIGSLLNRWVQSTARSTFQAQVMHMRMNGR